MTAAIKDNKVTAVLIPTGWYPCVAGSFKIERLELKQDPEPESEDWGFTFLEATGTTVVGRASALMAVRMTA